MGDSRRPRSNPPRQRRYFPWHWVLILFLLLFVAFIIACLWGAEIPGGGPHDHWEV